MRRPSTPSSSPKRNDAVGVGVLDQSRGSNRVRMSSMTAASVTLRVIGPACDSVPNGLAGQTGTSPYVGLMEKVPVNAAGMRNDPPPSVPTDHTPMPSATAAALPPLDPPAVSSASHGLPVGPCRAESVTPFQPSSGVVVLPSSTAPASRSRATAGESSVHGPFSSTSVEPRRVGQPRV